MTAQEIFFIFPNLVPENYSLNSEPLKKYNCVAWASGINYKRIDFYRNEKGEIDEDQSCNRYIEYFKTLGYIECETPIFENGFQKIALYEDRRGDFTYVALQLDNNTWTSKLGFLEDIEHSNLEALEGKGRDQYGYHSVYMKRMKK